MLGPGAPPASRERQSDRQAGKRVAIALADVSQRSSTALRSSVSTLATRHFWHRVAETAGRHGAVLAVGRRLIDRVTELSLKRAGNEAIGRPDTALVRLINRLSKAATVIVTGLFLLYLSDVDLTAALTGLGVGGLAIGFGAQKTIENLFGGIMMISDKPVNVGDACRVGEFFGTVEDIGIRSTRIRTLDRTVVCRSQRSTGVA